MKRPSERALDLADEILDHVRHGLTRTDAVYELADLVDESNAELIEAVRAVVRNAGRSGSPPDAEALARLREVLRAYQPGPVAPGDHEEFFPGTTSAPTLF
jgi:hypothetical protein